MPHDEEALAERVRNVIRDNRYLNMATHLGDEVWVAALAYYVSPEYEFAYFTSKRSRHAVHAEANPVVACCIYNSGLSSDDVDGIQFAGRVTQVHGRELATLVPKYFRQSFPVEEIRKHWVRSINDFKGLAVQRFYRIEPLNMYTVDLESIKVDKRIEVSLDLVRSVPMEK